MTRWLTIIGIGEDGLAGLSDGARTALARPATLFGGSRHLALVGAEGREAHVWPSGTRAMIDGVLARRGQPTCVLATGDPMWFGIGARLCRHVVAAEMEVFPALSTLALASARLGWRQSDVATVTLHGRPAPMLEPAIVPGARLLVLSAGPQTPGEVAARLLVRRGFGPSRLFVLERLGGPAERIRSAPAEGFDLDGIDPLNAVAIACMPGAAAVVRGPAPGIADDDFSHDGQLTKREVRAATLSRLMPLPDARLWDVGAGAGSIAIEWMRAAPRAEAIAIEARPERAAFIRANAEALGTPMLRLIEGRAPQALDGLPRPDAIFIGGGLGGPDGRVIVETCLAALLPGGRLVANVVTLAGERALIDLQALHGGDLTRLAVARAAPVGPHLGWRALMPVTQWCLQRPWSAS